MPTRASAAVMAIAVALLAPAPAPYIAADGTAPSESDCAEQVLEVASAENGLLHLLTVIVELARCADDRFPSVIDVAVTCADGGYDFAVTISSPYDSPERYADGWRVVHPDGAPVLGEHTLMHDHAAEQPFTRTQRGVAIAADVVEVVVEGRDLVNGYGGETVTVELPDCS